MGFSIRIRNRKGKLLGLELPIYFSLEQIITEEGVNPGTIAAILAQGSDILDAFRGASTVQDGVLARYSLSFGEVVDSTVPSGQTHEERVSLAYQAFYTDGSPPRNFQTSVPTPDLVNDWPFPAGTDRVYEPDAAAAFSIPAMALVENVREWLEAYGDVGISSVAFLYADLDGANT